jgi:hypothetical protein
MDMDLETLLTTVYVLVSDWYNEHIEKRKPTRPGPKPRLRDSEVLTLALVGQWRVGVPWQSERGLVRWANSPEGKRMFPGMLQRSQFNERVRDLYGVFVQLQQDLAAWLSGPDDIYECVDCAPLPAFSNSQALRDKAHWLFESTTGRGGTSGGYFYGDHLLISTLPCGAVTGWILATAYIQDRWLLEAFVSSRAGHAQLVGPPHSTDVIKSKRPTPPTGFIGPSAATGTGNTRPYLADKGFNGRLWQRHWKRRYDATVITVPPYNTPEAWPADLRRWLASFRQIVDTVFARLDTTFGMKRLNAHSRWGQLTRIAAKLAAYNLGLFINRLLNRPIGALATLIG